MSDNRLNLSEECTAKCVHFTIPQEEEYTSSLEGTVKCINLVA